jgi:CheY-like chemotaxis protein
MPVMSGWEAADEIRKLSPELPILITSGHDLDAATNSTQGLADACLKKPFRVENLRSALEAVTSRRAAK